MKLDPEDLRAFAARPWDRIERASRRSRLDQTAEERVQLAIDLYEAAKRTRPDWPTARDYQLDLEHHLRMRKLYDQVAHVFTG